MHRLLASIGLAGILVLAMQSSTYYLAAAQEEHSTQTAAQGPSVNDANLTVEKVVDGLTLPTTMAFLDQHRIVVLEKDNGTVRMVKDGKLQSAPLLDVAVANQDERGMLGIAVSKENETTTYVFLYFTASGGGVDGDDRQGVPPAGNRLYRYELQGDELVNPKLLLNLPAEPGSPTLSIVGRYVGGPIAIGPDNNVYVIIGDVDQHTTQAQNFANGPAPDGTSGVLRVGKSGQDPEPIIGTSAFGKYYFAYGIRNSFGLAFDPQTGKLWDTENGPSYGDEVNLVDPGFDSGWRKVQGVVPPENLTGLVLFNSRSHYHNPEFSWQEPVASTGLAFLNSTSNLGDQYQNDMFVGDFNNGAIYRFPLNETRTGFMLKGDLADKVANTPEENAVITFGTGFGGITDIKAGPDGSMYVVSLIDGAIYRIAHTTSPNSNESSKAKLTVNSANLSNNTITGMYTTISSSNGTLLDKGFTPLEFTGDRGSDYTVTVADFRSRHFDHWENGDTSRTRTVALDHDSATIVAYYKIGPEDATNAQTSDTINRLLERIMNGHTANCIDENNQHKLGNELSKIVKDLFSENKAKIDQLQKTLDMMTRDCANSSVQGNEGNHGSE
jgi:glucose/arabinose dehydrogenase